MTIPLWTYAAYLPIAGTIAWWVGRVLKQSGPAFVTNGGDRNEPFVDSLTKLLVMGFHLVALGAICFLMQFGRIPSSAESAVETLSVRIGAVLLAMGFMHFFVIARLAQFRISTVKRRPVAPLVLPGENDPTVKTDPTGAP